MHEGHRQRMLDRLAQNPEGLQEHEVLEILLYNAVPRKNTNPVAHNLISSFGSLERVFQAGVDQLMTVEGVGRATAEYLRCIALCYEKIVSSKNVVPVSFNVKTFSEYAVERFKGCTDEFIDIYCLDKSMRITFRKTFTSFEASKATVGTGEISRIIVAQAPFALVAAHNHPNASSEPSRQDDAFTVQLQMLCSMHNVKLYDHIIVGRDGFYSYCFVGRMEEKIGRAHV